MFQEFSGCVWSEWMKSSEICDFCICLPVFCQWFK
jgi:hypothetical protein